MSGSKEKSGMDALNEAYQQILGAGEPLRDDMASDGGRGVSDSAYQEDYANEEGQGVDPREDDTDVVDDDYVPDSADDEGDDDADGDDGKDDEQYSEDEFEEIPDRLVRAGRSANLSDDAIVELAEKRPEALEAIARIFESQARAPKNEPPRTDPEEGKDVAKFQPIKLDFDDDDIEEMGPKAMKIIQDLTKTVNALGEQVNIHGQNIGAVKQQSEQEQVRMIDRHFDSLSKEIPELGNSGNLTEEQKQNRIFAFHVARAATHSYGVNSIEQALAMGAKALTAQKSKSRAKQEIRDDLEKNKRRFIARGRGRQRGEGERKTVQDRAMDEINRILDSDEY